MESKTENTSLEYLKQLNINSKNKHEEHEIADLLISVVKYSLISNFNHDTYIVNAVCINKKSNKMYHNIFHQTFIDETIADEYYHNLKNKLFSAKEKSILKAVEKNNLALL